MDEVSASNSNNRVSNHDQKELVALDCNNSPSRFKIATLNSTIDTEDILMPCSNDCGTVLASHNLDDHISNACPMTMVDCRFKHVGCDVCLPREDMELHLGIAVVSHLSKHATSCEMKLKTLAEENERLFRKCEHLESELSMLRQQMTDMLTVTMSHKVLPQAVDRFSHPSKANASKGAEYVFALKPGLHHQVYGSSISGRTKTFTPGPVELTMKDFEGHQLRDDEWISSPFFTHDHGYKMCLRVTANGQGSGKGTHITVGVYLMNGEYDDQLVWPFRGDITIQLLNQNEGANSGHHSRTIHGAVGDRDDSYVNAGGADVVNIWSIDRYIPTRELHPTFLRNNTLKFLVFMELCSSNRPLSPSLGLVSEV